uniref:AB hydrolase-1 domain-containing protein n=1 Tax=Clastoptera arizonana TaxID=38151 RepID=A0A1B6D7U1_9HEMI
MYIKIFHKMAILFLGLLFNHIVFVKMSEPTMDFMNSMMACSGNKQETFLRTSDYYIKREGEPLIVYYDIPTKDGYLLTLHRIRRLGPPVLLVHGLFGSSDGWLRRGCDVDLAFILAKKGYDVWLADLRGNYYSRKHQCLNASDPKFWDFSMHEMGVYDLPALINKILQESSFTKISYVGYSMGSTVFLIMESEKPQLNTYIDSAFLLAPTVYPSKIMTTDEGKRLIEEGETLLKSLMNQNVYEIFPKTNLKENIIKLVFTPSLIDWCFNFLKYLGGSIFQKVLF